MLKLALLWCWPLVAAAPQSALEAARAHRDGRGAAVLEELADFLRLPNVASDAAGLQRNAEWIVAALQRRGASVELLAEDGVPPVVLAFLPAPGARRTLALYVHYDGQPVEPARWRTPPWTPVLATAPWEHGGRERPFPRPGEAVDPEWRLYARSAADDKAPLVAMLAALDALAAARLPVTSNLLFFCEGEEESGSPHLGRCFERQRQRLAAVDLWLICDGPVHPSRRPQLAFGVRGVASLEITVYGANRSLHSGHYGNWAPNPAWTLARLLASMKGEDGRVLIDGFYDGVAPASAAERAALARLPEIDQALREELGLAASEGTADLYESLLWPALNLRGLESAGVGELASNVIPAQASASLDLRLVPGNDPERMLDLVEEHLRKQGFHLVREEPDPAARRDHSKIARVVRGSGYPAARTPMDLPVLAPLLRSAERAAGAELLLIPSLGGSLPLHLFSGVLGTPAVIVPIVNHDDNQHAADENLRLANLWYGIDLFACVFAEPEER